MLSLLPVGYTSGAVFVNLGTVDILGCIICSGENVQQYPWPLPTGTHLSCANQKCFQTFPNIF